MNEEKIPENYQDIKDRIELMHSRGFDVSEDQLIEQTAKDGLQAIVNDLLDGEYFTVEKINEKQFDILGISGKIEGSIIAKGESFVADFKKDSQSFWNSLWSQSEKIIGR